MLSKIYSLGYTYPKAIIATVIVLTVFFAMQLDGLRWETDARVYLPKGHEAILYDEKVDDIFGVKDTLIVSIVNEEESIYNIETLARIARITNKITALPGIEATRDVDIASIATSTVFEADDTNMGSRLIMDKVPQTPEEIDAIKKTIEHHKDILVGNIVSADGSAAMIRVKIKEGQDNRYMTYFQVKAIIDAEKGEKVSWGPWGGGEKTDADADAEGEWEGNAWSDGSKWKDGKRIDEQSSNAVQPETEKESEKGALKDNSIVADASTNIPSDNFMADTFETATSDAPTDANFQETFGDWDVAGFDAGVEESSTIVGTAKIRETGIPEADPDKPVKDVFYLSGRPVIEVSAGLYSMEDMKIMMPLLIAVMGIVLLVIFRTWRGTLLPLMVMTTSIIWTFGLMVLLGYPLYTISTMLPIILVAVGIGDGVHLMSAYYDKVLNNPHESAKNIVKDATHKLGPPLIMTSVTTAIGFLALTFAEMPPFRVFGVFALIGILLSWVITITLLPAVLSMLQPKVGNYLAKRRAMRVYDEKNKLALFLTTTGRWIEDHKKQAVAVLGILLVIALAGTSRLYIDSSWMSDFKEDTDVAIANSKVNEKFAGSIFLNIVIEANEKNAFKNPVLLNKMEDLQEYVETLPYVGDTLSLVDYIKSMNKALNNGDESFNQIPELQKQIAEYLFLFSVSGRPQQLDEVIDYDYKTGLITTFIKTDHTKELKVVIDGVNNYVAEHFQGLDVDVNLAGSGNNSYVWADLLIGSQTDALVLSKVAILIVAGLVFASLIAGIYVVIPVTLSTLLVAGFAGIFSIPLDVSTALAAGIAIGVGVDYAVHFLFRYNSELKESGSHEQATANTLRTTGHTIVINAIVVSIGFAVLLFSSFPPHVKLGAFVTAYMIVSCLVAIWVLPSLLSYFRPTFGNTNKT